MLVMDHCVSLELITGAGAVTGAANVLQIRVLRTRRDLKSIIVDGPMLLDRG